MESKLDGIQEIFEKECEYDGADGMGDLAAWKDIPIGPRVPACLIARRKDQNETREGCVHVIWSFVLSAELGVWESLRLSTRPDVQLSQGKIPRMGTSQAVRE